MTDDEGVSDLRAQLSEPCDQMRHEAFELIEHAASLMATAARPDLAATYESFLAGEAAGDQLRTECQTVSDSLSARVGNSVTLTFPEDVKDIASEHRGLALQYGMARREGLASLAESTLEALNALDAIDKYQAMIDAHETVMLSDETRIQFIAFDYFASVESLQRSWRECAYGLMRLGSVPLIAEQMKDHAAVVARNNGRHKENRADKKRVLDWYAQNHHRFPRKSDAALAAIEAIGLDVSQDTVGIWLRNPRSRK